MTMAAGKSWRQRGGTPEYRDTITIRMGKRTFTGDRVMRGRQQLLQTISYAGRQKHDGHPYAASERALMDTVARIILRELVEAEE